MRLLCRTTALLLIAAWNIAPFLPIYPWNGDTYVDRRWTDYLTAFLIVNFPIWMLVLALWHAGKGRSPARRALIAETPALAQVAWFASAGPWGFVLCAAYRGTDGLLLYLLDRAGGTPHPGIRTRPNTAHSAEERVSEREAERTADERRPRTSWRTPRDTSGGSS